MPTSNPRVNVTLSPSLDALVARLAAAERVSKSMVLRELLEASEPALQVAVSMMEASEGATAVARERIAADMLKTVETINGVRDMAQAMAVNAARDLADSAKAIKGRRPSRQVRDSGPGGVGAGRRPKPKGPPSSNRGVKS